MFQLTGPILTQIAPQITGTRANEIARMLTDTCPRYGIDNADKFHEFIANVLHESAGFTVLSENLNYSVHALLSTFGRHRISAADAERFGRKPGQPANQQQLANILYGGSWGARTLGNTKAGDGWQFRGAGPIQITGRKNFTDFTAYYNRMMGANHTPERMAVLLRTDIRAGIHSACWVFAIAKKLIDEAERDEMREIVKRINGGYLGWDDRSKYYERTKVMVKDI